MRSRTGEGRAAFGCAGARIARGVLLLAALAAAVPASAAEVKVDLAVDREEVAVGEVMTLQLQIASPEAPSAVELPGEGKAFDVVRRAQSRQSSFSLGGGAGVQLRQIFTLQYEIAPRRAGTLTLGPATVVVAGARHESTAVTVKVLPAGAAPPTAPAPPAVTPRGGWRGWDRDLVLDAQVDRREAWLGEQLTVSVWLLSPVGVVAYENYKPPLYEGFWAEELETPQTLTQQVREVNGVPMRAYLLQRLALFPTRAGTITLGAFEASVAVRVGTDSPFDPFPDVRRVRRRSAPVSIVVKPLPAGAPQGFQSVNVGTYQLTAEAGAPSAQAGQPVTIRLTAAGEGNVRAVALPRLPPVANAQAFDPVASEKVAPRGARFFGTRVVETVLVPQRTGELVIPPLEWPTFDPRTGRYALLRTAELRLPVGAGAASGIAPAAGTNALAAGLRPIRADLSLHRRGGPPWRSPFFALAVAAPVLAYGGLALGERLRERLRAGAGTRRTRFAGRAARKRLAAARRLLARGEREAFFAEVERALVGYAADRLGRPAAGLTREALAAALADAGAHPPAIRALAGALDVCDAARFGRGAAAREEVLAAAERAMAVLEEADWRGPEVRA